jgi:hypothetical protein
MLKFLIFGTAFNLACVVMNAVFWATLDTFTSPLFLGWHLGLILCHAVIYGLTRPYSSHIASGRFQ